MSSAHRFHPKIHRAVIGVLLFVFALGPLLASHHFVTTGQDRAQFYAGTCLSVDHNCQVGSDGVKPSGDANLNLNYFLNFTAPIPPVWMLALSLSKRSGWRQVATDPLPPERGETIFHPPKR